MAQEFDFLILSSTRKAIIPIEVKAARTKSAQPKALKQLKKYQQIFQELFGNIFDETWQFGHTVYFHKANLNNEEICDACNLWTLQKDSDFQSWWKNIEDQFPKVPVVEQEDARRQLLKAFSLLLFSIHINTPITTTKSIEKVMEHLSIISDTVNIIFWSEKQLPLLESQDPKFKRVIFCSTYGSGKTLIIREKIERLASQGQKTLYILGVGNADEGEKNLLHLKLQNRWSHDEFGCHISILNRGELDVREEINTMLCYAAC